MSDLHCYEEVDIDSTGSSSSEETKLYDPDPIVETIETYHQFFVASVTGKLDAWVQSTYAQDKTGFRESRRDLALFSNHLLHQIMSNKTINTAQYEDSALKSPDAYNCFIDSMLRTNDDRDMELYNFLDENQHVAMVLQEELPTIIPIAKRWCAEHRPPPSQQLAASMMVGLSEPRGALGVPLKKQKFTDPEEQNAKEEFIANNTGYN